MHPILSHLLNYVIQFDEESLSRILSCMKPKTVKKNQILLAKGEVCNEFYFVVEGCLRTYFITKEAAEKTRYIMLGPSMGTALSSFISQQPSFEFIDAPEDSQVFAIDYANFSRLRTELPKWNLFYQRILEMAYSFQNKKIESLATLSAKQRYEQLLKENPGIVQKLSNKIVASYIDVAQETLSRLKSK